MLSSLQGIGSRSRPWRTTDAAGGRVGANSAPNLPDLFARALVSGLLLARADGAGLDSADASGINPRGRGHDPVIDLLHNRRPGKGG